MSDAMKQAKGIEKRACGCVIDHDRKVLDPCKDHVAEILAAMLRDNGGKLFFAKP